MTKKYLLAGAAMALAGFAAAHAQNATAPSAPVPAAATAVVANGDIINTAKVSGQFTSFLKALDAANLTAVVRSAPGLTVFAPTDAAFAALPPEQLAHLMNRANAAELQKVMTYHLITSRVDSTKIKGAKGDVQTVEGSKVTLDGSGDSLMVDNAAIVQADVMASNGIVHVIDKVLIPKDLPGAQAAAATDATATQPASATAK